MCNCVRERVWRGRPRRSSQFSQPPHIPLRHTHYKAGLEFHSNGKTPTTNQVLRFRLKENEGRSAAALAVKLTKLFHSQKLTKMNEKMNESEKQVFTAKVVNVLTNTENPDRISIAVDCEFPTINAKTGLEKQSNVFGISLYSLALSVGEQLPALDLACALAMGEFLNPRVASLDLKGATITFTREYKAAGEITQKGVVLENACYVTRVVSVKQNNNAKMHELAFELAQNRPTITLNRPTNDTEKPKL